jgi:hypothetical protein
LEERQKTREDEEEDVRSYWMALRKQEDVGRRKTKHNTAISEELNLEEVTDLS